MSDSLFRELNLSELIQRINSIPNIKSRNKRLVLLLGLLGDFDSFEYAQSIKRILPLMKKSSLELIIIGIGNI